MATRLLEGSQAVVFGSQTGSRFGGLGKARRITGLGFLGFLETVSRALGEVVFGAYGSLVRYSLGSEILAVCGTCMGDIDYYYGSRLLYGQERKSRQDKW